MSHPLDEHAMFYCCGTWRYKSGWHDCLGRLQGSKANDTMQVLVEIRAMEIAELSVIAHRPVLPLEAIHRVSLGEFDGWLIAKHQSLTPWTVSERTGWLAYQIAITP